MDHAELVSCIKELKMPSVVQYFADYSEKAGKEQWSFEQYLYELLNLERENRKERRIQKLLRESKLLLLQMVNRIPRHMVSSDPGEVA